MISSSKLLCSLETIKSNSLITSNVEPKKLRAAAMDSQRVELRSMLGSTLTDLFLNAVCEDGTTSGLTAIQETFYTEHLIPLFSKYTEAAAVYALHYGLSNNGIQSTTTSNSQPASDQAVKELHRRALNQADYFAIRAKAFILAPGNEQDLAVHYWQTPQNKKPDQNPTGGFLYLGEG